MTGAHPREGDLPAWLEEEPEPERRRSRPVVLVALAVIPWLVVAATVLRGDGAASGPAPSVGTTTTTTPVAPAPDTAGAARADGPAAVDDPATGDAPWTVVASGARTATTLQDAAAVALVIARAFAHGDGAPLDASGIEPAPLDGYVEHLVVEGVDHPGPDHAVVTLLAVVLRASDGRYATAEVRRLAVPVRVDGSGARAAGQPWWLPAPGLDVVAVPAVDVADEDLLVEAAEALQEAGYGDVSTLTLATTDGWPLVAEATARAPGEDAPRQHRLWLRRATVGLVVAGSSPDVAPSPTAPAVPTPPAEEVSP